MYAKRFQSLLAGEVGKTDLSQRAPDDMAQRFESLRGYRLLPAGSRFGETAAGDRVRSALRGPALGVT